MDVITRFLPQHGGILPKWLFFVSVVSFLNTTQAFTSSTYTGQLYSSASVTPHASRLFGTWTLLSSIIRLYGAYYINEPHVYDLTMVTYGVALAHFVSEWQVFGSATAKGRFLGPLIVASTSLAWMWTQRGFYLG
ncbi:hypothetical protein VTO42DRAFT_1339 [Malbranchea cinnamomea]